MESITVQGIPLFFEPEEWEAAQFIADALDQSITAHLKLPVWLNEGLAMVAVDRLLQKDTVQRATLDRIGRLPFRRLPRSYRKVSYRNADTLVALYARAYWTTRYLEARRPGLLKRLLGERLRKRAIEDGIAASFAAKPEHFWDTLDDHMRAHFADGPG